MNILKYIFLISFLTAISSLPVFAMHHQLIIPTTAPPITQNHHNPCNQQSMFDVAIASIDFSPSPANYQIGTSLTATARLRGYTPPSGDFFVEITLFDSSGNLINSCRGRTSSAALSPVSCSFTPSNNGWYAVKAKTINVPFAERSTCNNELTERVHIGPTQGIRVGARNQGVASLFMKYYADKRQKDVLNLVR